MNNKISLSYLILIIAPLFPNCSGPTVTENKINAPAHLVSLKDITNEKYLIYIKESVITWKGSSPMGSHTGYIYISKGEVMIEKDQLVGGIVEVDINTIEDEKHGSDNNLVNHLKDPDFFDVKKYPISTFAITKVESINSENIKVTGNLTIKGITNAVTFPAKIEVKNGIFIANSKLVIDRTQWDIRYKSGKFYDNLADETISDSIEFQMNIVAKK